MAYINIGAVADDGTGDTLRDVGGRLNIILPTRELVASEALLAGQIVNVHASSGAKMRKADADDTTKPAHGFVLADVANGDMGRFYGPGLVNNQLSGLTPGTVYYLSTTGGGVTATVPTTTLNGQQVVGVALSATELLFFPQTMIEAP